MLFLNMQICVCVLSLPLLFIYRLSSLVSLSLPRCLDDEGTGAYHLVVHVLSSSDIYIVMAHIGVTGNEIADYLAKRGATGVSSSTRPSLNFLNSV